MEVVFGLIFVIIYMYSYVDYFGGVSVWVEEGMQIWVMDVFMPHFIK